MMNTPPPFDATAPPMRLTDLLMHSFVERTTGSSRRRRQEEDQQQEQPRPEENDHSVGQGSAALTTGGAEVDNVGGAGGLGVLMTPQQLHGIIQEVLDILEEDENENDDDDDNFFLTMTNNAFIENGNMPTTATTTIAPWDDESTAKAA